MSVVITENGTNRLHRSTNVVSGATATTVMFWVKPTTHSVTADPLWVTVNGLGTYTKYAALYNITANYDLQTNDGATLHDTADGAVTNGTWKHLAYTRSGSTQAFFVNGVSIGTNVLDLSAAGFSDTVLGDDTGGTGSV